MIIQIQKFGTTLTSRQSGKEAYLALQQQLQDLQKDEHIELDFEGVVTFTPSWADEFITPLQKKYGDRVHLKNTENPSVKATLGLLQKIREAGPTTFL